MYVLSFKIFVTKGCVLPAGRFVGQVFLALLREATSKYVQSQCVQLNR